MRLAGTTGARQVIEAPDPRLDGAYRLRVSVMFPNPPARDSSADVLFNARDDGTCYIARLRVRDGVRYVTVSKGVDGLDETLFDDIYGFNFGQPLDLEISRLADRVVVTVDGDEVAVCADPLPISGGAVGFRADGIAAEFGEASVTALGALPASPLRETGRPNRGLATGSIAGSIQNGRYEIEFARAADGYVANIRVDDRRLAGGQWAVLEGTSGSRRNLWASLSKHWMTFDDLVVLDAQTARLAARGDEFDLTVTWDLTGTHPRAAIELTPKVEGQFVVAYQAFTANSLDEVDEVLCGPLQHAKMVRGPESVGTDELSAPLALVQRDGQTVGVFVPSDELPFGNERALGDDGQPFGLSLRNHVGEVQPVVFAPQYGRHSALHPGDTYRFAVGVFAQKGELYRAYKELVRDEYGYRPYRQNVFDASLTDTVHNLIELLKSGADEDDRVDYRPSPSGWWSRAKGFIDIENDQAVRATTTSVLLSAYYLTGDDEFYERRALPTIEYHLSRNGYGWTPRTDRDVYGDTTKHRLCSTPFGVPALGPLSALTRGLVPAVRHLALDAADREDYWLQRTPMSRPLATFRLTGDELQLTRANDLARRYVADEVERAYETNVDPHDFANCYAKAWVELLEMYEETGDKSYLDAAYREAKRYVTQLFVRPIPDGSETFPERPLFIDRQIEMTGWWEPDDLFDYPDDDIADEEVPRWILSTTGMGFEALKTYRHNGHTLNPGWAPFLLRLASYADDDLLRDIAHNTMIGRFTNYPGYYFRQLSVNHMKPDFPYRGPFGNTTIYYHHAPAQLGMTIDYLLAEHQTRSEGNIEFPAEFEQNYVWFAFHVYGHLPGRFYGHDGVWLWMPRGFVTTDNSLVNWIAGVDGRRVFVSLTNSAATEQRVRVKVSGADANSTTVIADNGRPSQTTMTDGFLDTSVSGHGITALVIDDVSENEAPERVTPGAAGPSFVFDDESPVGAVRGLTVTKPDGRCYHAYVQAATDQNATLSYSTDGGQTYRHMTSPAYPNEWTVRVDDVATPFTYYVQVGDTKTAPVVLRSALADQ